MDRAKAKEDRVNLGGKEDFDALLRGWPAILPRGVAAGAEEERGWEERADAIVRAAEAARGAAKDAEEALFAAPALAAEPGEEAAGEKKMSQEKESGEAPASTTAPAVSERKRTSLKEMAARASQSGARLSSPGAAPPPSVTGTTRPSTPAPRPSEAGKDDSGVINLKVVQASATPQQVAAAEKAKPAQADLFEDDKPSEPAKQADEKPAAAKPAVVTALPAKKSNAGAIGGIAIAVIGIAAAFAILARKPAAPPPQATAPEKPAPAVTAPAAPVQTAAPTAVATADPAPSASAEADTKVAEAPKNGAGSAAASAATGAATGAATADPRLAKAATPSGKTGDLQSEMAKAVGKDGAAKPDQAAPTPEPAAGRPTSQNIPEQPSQGAVAAAFGPVMGSAKACVAGADDVSRASVTFSSSGAVTSVSVSGWAAAHGKSGCVQAALKAAKVGPFSKPSFTVGVPIRP